MRRSEEQKKIEQRNEKRRLAKMSYWQLLEEEDKILLEHESLSIRSAKWDKVKWDGGRIFMSSFAVLLWIVSSLVFTHSVATKLPAIIAHTPLIIAPYLILGFMAISLVDRLWHKSFTPFGRTIVRGIIHYWPATIVTLILIFV